MSIAALAAAWLAVALDQATRAFVGSLAGIPSRGLVLSPERGWTVVAQLDPAAGSAIGWAIAVVAGSLIVILVTSVVHWITVNIRGSGLTRGFALAASTVGLIWAPTALAAGLFPGTGPGSELYGRLGEPQAGRWSALAMGLVLLAVVAGPVATRAIATGRSWMRADGLEFRRRLVRVQAGWPGVAAIVGLCVGAGWDRTPWLAVWLVAVLAAFHLRTR